MSDGPLKAQLEAPEIVVAPGVYDGLSGLLVEQAGFPAAYLSGGSIAYARFGRPDVGLVGMDEVARVVAAVAERIAIPLVVDADTGFGNALNVKRTVRTFEREGAAAIQLEDQVTPKRCGHLEGKMLISTAEMVGKVEAALDARRSGETLIIARTDAIASDGLEAALDRAEAYLEAGADVLFLEAPPDETAMRTISDRFRGRAPLLANMVEGGRTPMKSAAELEALGYAIVIFPGGLVRAFAHMARDYLASLKAHGTTSPFRSRMLDFRALNDLLGTPELLAEGRRYEAKGETDD